MPKVSVIVPVYNVEPYVAAALHSVLDQTYRDFEVIVVDDASPDRSVEICRSFRDPRLRIVQQANRGLAGARNTGIRHARGEYLAFLDSDDLWAATKLQKHVAHLDSHPEVGLSFSRSAFIDGAGQPLNYYQMPRLSGIDAAHLLCRNPVGNGSAPVIRRQTLADIAYPGEREGEPCYFDEQFRQSEDIECWVRIALQTGWQIEGIPEALTFYRVNAGGLSAVLLKQLASWERMIEKTRSYAPELIAAAGNLARAYQLRYLARRAVQLRDGAMAVSLMRRAIATDKRILIEEPRRTLLTALAALVLLAVPADLFNRLEAFGMRRVARQQERIIAASGLSAP
ncbi:glycosyltransferase family 2 protein [Gloeobacter kilaueensis]|uniref:Glycosyl transferase family 2 n=1 Tax=Gloeobacter kilaueensis (strain ATCC BAA-2537 / CCAP 1431/1 / ULC 316 / JS1) TaxID=1183438 RepID=U5QR99_GLOK1|nr:glycosyltransferase family A protein [Gloeobacter kilaueensis]AGY60245.1 glycosyl transferase family 2 [Gloeobacter kilaueensis JS1]